MFAVKKEKAREALGLPGFGFSRCVLSQFRIVTTGKTAAATGT
jgi:hypothetical protein